MRTFKGYKTVVLQNAKVKSENLKDIYINEKKENMIAAFHNFIQHADSFATVTDL